MEKEIIKLVQGVQEKRKKGKPDSSFFKEFIGAITSLINQNRISARDVIIKVLKSLTDEGKLLDPSIRDRDINVWFWCAQGFQNLRDHISADSVMEQCYLHMLALQKKNKKRYHKGTPLQTRAMILSPFGKIERAKKYALLAYIEDIISGQPYAPAWETLKNSGVSEQDLKIVQDETHKLMEEKIGSEIYYPEEIYQRIQYRIEYGTIGEVSKAVVFTNPIYLDELLNRVECASKGKNNDLKRSSLEYLAQYLFSSIEGLYVKPSQVVGPFQLDGVIVNISNHPFLKTLDTFIPIECKNWKKAIGSPVVTMFLGKLSLFKCNMGILISKNGIKKKTVNEIRKDAARRNNVFILVFNETDIKDIIAGKDLVSLMLSKYEDLKFSIKM